MDRRKVFVQTVVYCSRLCRITRLVCSLTFGHVMERILPTSVQQLVLSKKDVWIQTIRLGGAIVTEPYSNIQKNCIFARVVRWQQFSVICARQDGLQKFTLDPLWSRPGFDFYVPAFANSDDSVLAYHVTDSFLPDGTHENSELWRCIALTDPLAVPLHQVQLTFSDEEDAFSHVDSDEQQQPMHAYTDTTAGQPMHEYTETTAGQLMHAYTETTAGREQSSPVLTTALKKFTRCVYNNFKTAYPNRKACATSVLGYALQQRYVIIPVLQQAQDMQSASGKNDASAHGRFTDAAVDVGCYANALGENGAK